MAEVRMAHAAARADMTVLGGALGELVAAAALVVATVAAADETAEEVEMVEAESVVATVEEEALVEVEAELVEERKVVMVAATEAEWPAEGMTEGMVGKCIRAISVVHKTLPCL